jgi:ankyrin repeat protein
MLLDAGADPSTEMLCGIQPIHFAAHRGQTKTIEMLLDRGVEVDWRGGTGDNNTGSTALHLAIEYAHEATMALLISQGADPSLAFENLWTCVLMAAKSGNIQILQLVLGHCPYRFNDACEPERWTPLHLAARHGHRIATKLLLEAGWDSTATDAAGRTPAALASEHEHQLTMEMIRDFHARAPRESSG